MARTLNPFTRITLLVGELNGNKVENLLDVTRCDLLYHTTKLIEDLNDLPEKDAALQIDEQGKLLISLLKGGDLTKAEDARKTLILNCKTLKNVL